MKKRRGMCLEEGQAMVEFALILPILILLLMLPIEYHRVIKTKLILETAASDTLLHTAGDFENVGAYKRAAQRYLSTAYGEEFKNLTPDIEIRIDPKHRSTEPDHFRQIDYIYRVYTSEKADQEYNAQFDERPSHFKTVQVAMKISTEVRPITLLGKQFLGDTVAVHTRAYTRNIYAEGYKK